MKGLTVIETEAVDRLISQIRKLEEAVKSLENNGKLWMTVKETCAYLSKSSTWLDLNKSAIGFAKAGGEIRFKRVDVDSYLESRYFKS